MIVDVEVSSAAISVGPAVMVARAAEASPVSTVGEAVASKHFYFLPPIVPSPA